MVSVNTGTIVARLSTGNMMRAPNRSVSAPTGMRPSEPTTTGTATSSDWAAKLSPRRSLTPGARGPSSAHAQKLTVNPRVAITRLRVAARPVVPFDVISFPHVDEWQGRAAGLPSPGGRGAGRGVGAGHGC